MSIVPGCLLDWPRELGWPAAARANWAGWLLRASGPSRPSQLRAFFFSFSLFLFYFSSLFKFQIDLKFEFKIGVP